MHQKRVFCTLSVLTQWKHWETCKRIELCKLRLSSAKTRVFLRLNAFFSVKEVNCAKTCFFCALCKVWLTSGKTSFSLRFNTFFSKNDVKLAKTRYIALKRVFGTLSVLTQWKHWETCKRIELCKIRLTSAKTSVSLRLNAFFSKNDVKCAKTRYLALKTRFWTLSVLTQWKHWETCKRIEICKIRLTSAKTSISLRLNDAFFSKNDVKCVKTRYFALKRVFCTLSVLTQWKHWETCKRIELCKIRLSSAKTSVFFRLNAFFSEIDVICSKTCYFALETRFWHIIGFKAMKALGNVQTH